MVTKTSANRDFCMIFAGNLNEYGSVEWTVPPQSMSKARIHSLMEHDTPKSPDEQFVQMLAGHEHQLRAFIRSMGLDWSAVDDVVQTVSLVMWRKWDQFDPDTDFMQWARVIARFEVLKFRRRMARDRHVFRDELMELTAGDNISNTHQLCGAGNKECVKPYAKLIDHYPKLFRSTPFMPVLGNHDKEMRPRGSKPPDESVYDIDATAFRRFFELPNDEWKWHFDVPGFDVRFAALDLNHISDFGTTWQASHSFKKDSEQFRWYDKLMVDQSRKFVVTLYNERNGSMRAQEQGAWHEMFRKGTVAITGFGYYAERAEVDGFTYYNTSLSGKGNQYPDSKSKFLQGADSYILLTLTKNPAKMKVEIKGLDGSVLDRKVFGE